MRTGQGTRHEIVAEYKRVEIELLGINAEINRKTLGNQSMGLMSKKHLLTKRLIALGAQLAATKDERSTEKANLSAHFFDLVAETIGIENANSLMGQAKERVRMGLPRRANGFFQGSRP